MKPDVVHLSSCPVNAEPWCPYTDAEELSKILEEETGIEVILGTHDYHWSVILKQAKLEGITG